ncbi:MAG: nucleotide exchange factor GrpE [Clostridia bacterium]|nr:nucleotide exchange factor GrpE [Clostridia bacterium]
MTKDKEPVLPAEETPQPEELLREPPEGEAQPAEQTEAQTEPVTLSAAEFNEVRKHIETLQKEKDETVNLCQHLQADFDNYRKRNASLHLDSVNEGERNVIKALLPVLDNFDRAMENIENVDPAWVDGLRLVQKQLLDALAKFGLEEIGAEGKFDPNLHEAVMQQETEGVESGTIVMVMQKGYKVKDRIVRHSMVGVAK